MSIEIRKLTKSENNYGFCYTTFKNGSINPFSSGRTSFFIHKEGVVAIHYSPSKSFWNNKGQILLDFVKDGFIYTTCLDYVKGKKSLGMRIDIFVKECIKQ